ncbi:MipA/OmpV family protein, partial [Marivita sp.]
MLARLATVSSLALGLALPAYAAGPAQTATQPDVMVPAPTPAKPQLMFTLRGGVATSPEYFGSDENVVGPDLGFSFNYLSLRNGRTFGNPDPWADSMGLTFGGSFRFIQERKTDDFDELAGLDDIDAAVELGVSMRYGT